MNTMHVTPEEEEALKRIKNQIHEHPELSWEEEETAALIRRELITMPGLTLVENPLKTAVIARIKGEMPGMTIALRADIDALKADEAWKSDHVSQVPGVAHACGHDFHTAALLGAARILSRNREKMAGDAILIFQPAEETTNGAAELIKTGLFKDLKIDAIFGLHNRPEIPAGQVVLQEGPLMAAKKNFKITLYGVGGHGSMPHKCVDPLVCMAAIIQALQTIVSRNTDPLDALVLSVGSVHGGSQENLIVDEVEMTASMRYFRKEVGERTMERLHAILENTAAAYECGVKLEMKEELPALINGEAMTAIARDAAEKAMGKESLVTSAPGLATEDYALFMEEVPGYFYWLGSGDEEDTVYSWHNSRFHTNDDTLKDGAALLAQSVISAQENKA